MKLTKKILIAGVFGFGTELAFAQLSAFERYERDRETEQALTESLTEKFLQLQELSKHQGRKVRGTHAKGTCAAGEFEVFGHIAGKYRQGLFANPAVYQTRVRFANGASSVQPDHIADARGVSLSIDLGDGGRQDFAMNNGPIFPIGNLRDFNFLMDISLVKGETLKEALAAGKSLDKAKKSADRAALLHIAKHPGNVPGFLKILKLGNALKNQEVMSYRNLKYWSGSAFRFGDQVAKFALSPCRRHLSDSPDTTDPDFLQKDLMGAINSSRTPTCFDFQVQLLDAEKMRANGLLQRKKLAPWQWVEDVTLDWDEAGATWYTVGRLTLIPFGVIDQTTCDDPGNAIDVIGNALPEHQGLGRINRARRFAEVASSGNR